VGADPRLCALLDRQASELLARLPRADALTERTRQAVHEAIRAGDPTLERTARALGMSTRSLQRHLRAQGTTHRRIVDEVRREMAIGYVERAELGLSEVAFVTGFTEAAAFHRAFKRWTGRTASAFRSERRS
jgi:AraC-like DNA-binding protein